MFAFGFTITKTGNGRIEPQTPALCLRLTYHTVESGPNERAIYGLALFSEPMSESDVATSILSPSKIMDEVKRGLIHPSSIPTIIVFPIQSWWEGLSPPYLRLYNSKHIEYNFSPPS